MLQLAGKHTGVSHALFSLLNPVVPSSIPPARPEPAVMRSQGGGASGRDGFPGTAGQPLCLPLSSPLTPHTGSSGILLLLSPAAGKAFLYLGRLCRDLWLLFPRRAQPGAGPALRGAGAGRGRGQGFYSTS